MASRLGDNRQELHWHAHGSDLTSFLDDARPVQG